MKEISMKKAAAVRPAARTFSKSILAPSRGCVKPKSSFFKIDDKH